MEILEIILLALAGLPIIVYPGILLAGVMSLGAMKNGSGENEKLPVFVHYSMLFFIWGSLLYPFVYIACFKAAKRNTEFSHFPIAALFVYFALLMIFFKIWDKGSKKKTG